MHSKIHGKDLSHKRCALPAANTTSKAGGNTSGIVECTPTKSLVHSVGVEQQTAGLITAEAAVRNVTIKRQGLELTCTSVARFCRNSRKGRCKKINKLFLLKKPLPQTDFKHQPVYQVFSDHIALRPQKRGWLSVLNQVTSIYIYSTSCLG